MSKARPKQDIDATRERLDGLGLAHVGESLDQVLTDAVSADLPAHAFLDKLLHIEQERREERRIRTSLRLLSVPTKYCANTDRGCTCTHQMQNSARIPLCKLFGVSSHRQLQRNLARTFSTPTMSARIDRPELQSQIAA